MADKYCSRLCGKCGFETESTNLDIFMKHQSNNDPEVEEHKPSTSGTKYSAPSTSKVSFEDSDDSVPIFWSERATRILLTEVKQREETTNKGKNTKKKMWLEIADVLKKNGFLFTWEQVKGKWGTLIAALKRTNDHNSRSGADKKTCAYQKELEDILQGNPTIQPVATAGTSILSKGSKRKTNESIGPLPDLELDENTESESDQLQPPKQVKVKRKSGSSEVLDVLNQYIEEQKKDKEEEKRARMQMHEDKMHLFRELINEMKK